MTLGYFSLAQKHNIYILQDSKLFFCYLMTSNCQICYVLANGSNMTSYISVVVPCRAGKLVESDTHFLQVCPYRNCKFFSVDLSFDIDLVQWPNHVMRA